MANLTGPWATGATRRPPTQQERINGFSCGPADKMLFDHLFNQLHGELGHLIAYSGQTQSDGDMEQVRKAIQALIDAAIGGGPSDTYVLMAQARSRLPFLPAAQTSDGKINVISPGGGQVQVPTSVTVLHRGIFPISTSDFSEGERTFNTSPSKTYHVRLTLSAGAEELRLEDLDDNAYNPDGEAENHVDFISTYDDMLIATVVTNGSNVATISNHVNNGRWPSRDGKAWWARLSGQGQSAQSIPSGVDTRINNLRVNQGNLPAGVWTNTKLSIAHAALAGVWIMEAGTNVLNETRETRLIFRNGTEWARAWFSASAGSSNGPSVTSSVPLGIGDEADFRVFHSTGVNVDTQSGYATLAMIG